MYGLQLLFPTIDLAARGFPLLQSHSCRLVYSFQFHGPRRGHAVSHRVRPLLRWRSLYSTAPSASGSVLTRLQARPISTGLSSASPRRVRWKTVSHAETSASCSPSNCVKSCCQVISEKKRFKIAREEMRFVKWGDGCKAGPFQVGYQTCLF